MKYSPSHGIFMSYTQKALVAAASVLLCSPAFAGNVTLQGNCVKIGTSDLGTIGSQGNTSPGILYDSTCTSTFNPSYDYLTPGTPFEGWTIKGLDGTTVLFNHSNNNASYTSNNPVTGTNVDYSGVLYKGTTYDNRAVWSGSTSNFNIEHDVRFNDGQQFVDINTTIEVLLNVPTLYFGRFTDPDARAATGDSSGTLNTRGYAGGIPATNVVLSEALVSKYTLGLFTGKIGGVNAGVSGGWSTDPLDYYNGTDDGDGDYTIGLGFIFSGLSAGDIVNVQYAYIFGPSAFAAGSGAVSGGAGGSTPTTFTVLDAGSASAPTTPTPPTPSTPTIVSTSTVNNVSSSTAQSTTLPVVIVSLDEHTATENSGTQKIAVKRTTNVTTPYVTTTITTPVTTDTYSDSSTVVTNGTPTTTYTLINQVDTAYNYKDLYGHIDQYDTLDTINNSINGLLDHEPSQTKEKFRVFSNNHYIYSYADGYTASSTTFGGGFEVDIKPTWTVGAQYNKVNIDLLGTDSISSQKKDHIGVFNALYSKWTTLNTNFGYAMNTYKVGRTVEYLFYNQSEPKGTEWWLHNRLYVHPTTGVAPYVGYTVGQLRRDGYTEIGSIQSARTVDALNQTNHTGEVGLKLEHKFGKFGVSVDGSYATDNVVSASASINYNEIIFIEGNYDTDGTVSNASGAAKVKFRF